ncbi:competence/damage-inducible protein A [Magnetovibrio blakemorei]|uniref:Molybdopterin-binding protein n=1 Tax=Magnetovibrio blakemorei TaxID=28181 RepID=A0A1E5Q4U8_9PROT|nr:molybdopterin-binding protein [Magnetovibrio blakemorei]OEJ65085.1 molybdopterin-binding protein [Magnetovibrio blakemorei]
MNDTSPQAGSTAGPTACVLVIGNEVLSGRTKDANINYLAEELTKLGIPLVECRVIRDVEAEIIEAVNACRAKYTYVFTTGGIGSTHDDITAKSVAAAFGLDFGTHPEAERILLAHYGDKANTARMRMAMTPAGAHLIDNPVSKAPGFRVENVYVMAGVPVIARAMFDGIKGTLKGGRIMVVQTVSTIGISEGMIGEELRVLQDHHASVDIGSYPFLKFGGFGTNLVVRGADKAQVEAACADIRAMIKAAGGTPLDGETEGEELK